MKKKRRSETPEYIAWSGMIRRCTNTSAYRYDRYGGRGIKVCDQWMSSFEKFLEDVGKKPSPSHTLERKDNDGNYEPTNVVWETRKKQARNRRTNHLLEFRGEKKTIAEWSEVVGISASLIESRIRVCGYTVERALTQPTRGWGPGKPKETA